MTATGIETLTNVPREIDDVRCAVCTTPWTTLSSSVVTCAFPGALDGLQSCSHYVASPPSAMGDACLQPVLEIRLISPGALFLQSSMSWKSTLCYAVCRWRGSWLAGIGPRCEAQHQRTARAAFVVSDVSSDVLYSCPVRWLVLSVSVALRDLTRTAWTWASCRTMHAWSAMLPRSLLSSV